MSVSGGLDQSVQEPQITPERSHIAPESGQSWTPFGCTLNLATKFVLYSSRKLLYILEEDCGRADVGLGTLLLPAILTDKLDKSIEDGCVVEYVN